MPDHDACIADKALAGHVRGYIDVEIGEEHSFRWGMADLDGRDLFHIRKALHDYFRKTAAEQIGDPQSMGWHVSTIQRVGELVAAIEVVETAQGEANTKQTRWRQSEQSRKYQREQAEMRRKAAERVAAPVPSSPEPQPGDGNG